MQAKMQMHFETAWANQITLSVVAELDNPHTLTTREVASLMLSTLTIMAEEARAENERHIIAIGERGDRARDEARERGVMERSAKS